MSDNEPSPQASPHHTTAKGLSELSTNDKTPLKARASGTIIHGLKHPNRKPRRVQLSEEMERQIVEMDTGTFFGLLAGADPKRKDLAKFRKFDKLQLNQAHEHEMYPHIVSHRIS